MRRRIRISKNYYCVFFIKFLNLFVSKFFFFKCLNLNDGQSTSCMFPYLWKNFLFVALWLECGKPHHFSFVMWCTTNDSMLFYSIEQATENLRFGTHMDNISLLTN